MATTLLDSPPAPESEPKPPAAPAGAADGQSQTGPGSAAPPAAPVEHACAHCGAPMALSQEWCTQCGAGAPGSVGSSGWRPAATILVVTGLLVLGAAAAGYAALTKKAPRAAIAITTVAQAPAPTTTAPVTPVTPGTPSTITPLPPSTVVTPPKIPLTAKTPLAVTTPITPAAIGTGTGAGTTTTPSTSGSGGSGANASEEATSKAILLDTNAASTYNPYGYPAAGFGDPSLTIDGDATTAWTAQVQPATAPKMAEGVLIDLKTPTRLGSVKLTTVSPGMTVQLYGANGHKAPASITDAAWVPLSHLQAARKKNVTITVLKPKKAFRFVTLWISLAPAASVGTAQAPGHVSVNELELFPPA